MIDQSKIKWEDDENGGSLYYKGIKLKMSPEIIQGIATGFISTEKVEEAILIEYKKQLRIAREIKLNKLLNDRMGNNKGL